MDAGKEYMRMLEEEWEEMREEFSFLKEENINNLQKEDLPGEKWFEVYYKDKLFKTRMSNLGRFKIGNMIIERNDIRVPFGQICIVYKEVQSTKDKRKNFILVRAIDVMRTTRDYYGDDMFEVEQSSTNPRTEQSSTNPRTEVAHYGDEDIVVFNNDGNIIGVYKTRLECSTDLDIPYKTISNGIYIKCHILYKYRIFKGKDLTGVTKIEPKYYQEIRLYDAAGHFVEEFEDVKAVENKYSMPITTVRGYCNKFNFSRQCNCYLMWKKDVGNAEVIDIPDETQNYSRWVILDSNKNLIGYFNTSREVAKLIGINQSTAVKVARGTVYKAGHFHSGYYIYREDKYLKIYKYHEEE